MADTTPKVLIDLYAAMAELTLSECKRCRNPYSCCSPEYCEFTIGIAQERGVELPRTAHTRLPLMGLTGCTAPPHLRPLCTAHTCDIGSLGFKRPNSDRPGESEEWTEKYFELRSKIEIEELRLRGVEI